MQEGPSRGSHWEAGQPQEAPWEAEALGDLDLACMRHHRTLRKSELLISLPLGHMKYTCTLAHDSSDPAHEQTASLHWVSAGRGGQACDPSVQEAEAERWP